MPKQALLPKTPGRLRKLKLASLLAAIMALGAPVTGSAAAAPSGELTRAELAFTRPAATAMKPHTFIVPAAAPVTPTPSELQDLSVIATERGLQLEEVIGRYGWRQEFFNAVDRLRSAYPTKFTTAAVGSGDGYEAWVSFHGPAPDDLSIALGSVPVPVQVRSVNWSEAAVVEAAKKIHYAVLADTAVASDVATDPDLESGEIRVSVKPPYGASASSTRDRIAAIGRGNTPLQKAIITAPASIRVTIEVNQSLEGGVDVVDGGGPLSGCTAGFTVWRNSAPSEHGVTTAGHCDNYQTYNGRAVLTFISAHEGAYGDVQWHRSSEYVSNRFFYNTGATRPATGTGTAGPGAAVCKFGQTSGQTCDEVYKTNQCRGIYCGPTMTHRRKAAGGDSGGPWFYGNTAYGIHSGWKTDNLFDRDMFTPISQAHTRLGVSLRINI